MHAPKPAPVSSRAARVGALLLVLMAIAWLWHGIGTAPRGESGRLYFGLWRTRHVAFALGLGWCAAGLLLAAVGRRALVRFLVVHATCAIGWLLLEATGLIGLVDYPALLSTSAPETLGMRRMPLVELRGEMREDLAAIMDLPRDPLPFHYKTDRHGFRNAADRADAEIYCLGDSFLVAGLVAVEDTLGARLERQWSRSVLSVALCGLAPQEERLLLIDTQLPLADRLVLQFVFEGNDLLDSARWRSHANADVLSWQRRSLLNQLILRTQAWTQSRAAGIERTTGWLAGEAYRFHYLRSSFEGLDAELEPVADALLETCRDVRAAGGTFAVVLIPAKIRVLGPHCSYGPESELADWQRELGPLPAYLESRLERAGIAYLDLTPALAGATASGEIPWFPADTHWNATGHRVAAAALADWPPVQAWLRARSAQ
jgi:hypothetical protein